MGCTVQHSLNRMDFPFICLCELSHIWFFVTPWTVAHQAPLSVDFAKRILEWIATSFSRGSSLHWDWTHVSCVSCIRRSMFLPLCNLGSPRLWSYWFFSYHIPVQCSSILYQLFQKPPICLRVCIISCKWVNEKENIKMDPSNTSGTDI